MLLQLEFDNTTYFHAKDGSDADLGHTRRRGGFSATVGIAGPQKTKPEKPPIK